MDAATAVLEPPAHSAHATLQLDGGRVRDIVLVRIATAAKVLTRAELSHDLWPMVAHVMSLADWQAALDRDLGALADAGLCEAKPVAVSVTAAGMKRAALVLGIEALPRTWAEAKATRLVAKAMGIEAWPPRRLKALAKADGLRAAVVQHGFKLKVRGLATPAKLRAALAKVALSRAFGHTLPVGTDARSGLSAKIGRSLAGRLAQPAREFPTDARLIAQLAMEYAGAAKTDFETLQTALLRRYVTRGALAIVPPTARQARRHKTELHAQSTPPMPVSGAPSPILRLVETTPADGETAIASGTIRPDFESFVAAVRRAASGIAEGWPGNRKAFVSRVWAAVQAQNPAWSVSAVEFKAMLAESHRLGQIVLANADLKDQRAIGELQASAIAYKNAIFHYVRVDD